MVEPKFWSFGGFSAFPTSRNKAAQVTPILKGSIKKMD